MRRFRGFAANAATLVWVTACAVEPNATSALCKSDGDLSPGIQAAMRYAAPIPVPVAPPPGKLLNVSVHVTDPTSSYNLCNVEIRWIPGQASGTVSPGTSFTDSLSGNATTQWTLPLATGAVATLTAEVVGSNPRVQLEVNFLTQASSPAALSRNPIGFPEPQFGVVGQAVQPPSVRVTDQLGQPLGGVAVNFYLLNGFSHGTGTLVAGTNTYSYQATTDLDGVASTPTWILGDVGENVVIAELGLEVVFTAIAAAAVESSVRSGEVDGNGERYGVMSSRRGRDGTSTPSGSNPTTSQR